LFGAPLPASLLKLIKRLVKPVLGLFRSIHSGYIGDYVTWLMIGSSVLLLVAILL
jgi:multicomponent Na+:H+ antiporter subunit D